MTEVDGMFRWSLGGWFAVVDANRSAEAMECRTESEVQQTLVLDADCGGIFDCSDEAVLVRAGLISVDVADDEPADESLDSLELMYIRNSGVFAQ